MTRGKYSGEMFTALPSLTVAAHELKSPLALVRQLSLLLGDETLSDSQRDEYRRQLIAVSDRALRLTTDLTQVASIQPSLLPLEPVNPFSVCHDIALELQPFFRMYNRSVRWPRARKNVLAVANSKLLGRIISNFVENATRYTEPNTEIAVSVKQSNEKVRVSVRDFGPRMSNSEFRRLIAEMEQVKSVRTRPDSSGLGVYVASRFASAMSGSIGLTRHRDGVTFFVELPISRQLNLL